MLTLAVTTDGETLDRITDPLSERGIAAEYLSPTQRTIHITGDSPLVDFDLGFVFPGRLMEGGAIDALSSMPWLNDRSAVLTSRNKAEVIARLDQAGLPVPETVLISNPADRSALAEAFERVGTPALVKPNSTTRGNGIVRVDTRDDLYGVADYLDLIHEFPATGDKSFLLQEYVPNARDIRAMVLDGQYVGAVERAFPTATDGRYVRNVHRGADATGVTLEPALQDLVEAVGTELGIPLLGVDLLVTDDQALIIETNARPTIDNATKYVDGFYDRLAGTLTAVTRS